VAGVNTVITIQIPGRDRRYEKFLRAEVEGGVEELRKAVTRMMRKPSDFDLSTHRYTANTNAPRGKRPPPVIRDDEIVEIPGV
jgi:hypothetical protein